VIKKPPLANQIPEMAQADATIRRFQQFKIQLGKTYEWQILSGHTMSTGKVSPDASNLLTIPEVTLATSPSVLTLKEAQP